MTVHSDANSSAYEVGTKQSLKDGEDRFASLRFGHSTAIPLYQAMMQKLGLQDSKYCK